MNSCSVTKFCVSFRLHISYSQHIANHVHLKLITRESQMHPGALHGEIGIFYSIEVSIAKSKHCHGLLPCRCIKPTYLLASFPGPIIMKKPCGNLTLVTLHCKSTSTHTGPQSALNMPACAWLFTVGIVYSPPLHLPIGVGADPYGPGSLYQWCCTRDVAE